MNTTEAIWAKYLTTHDIVTFLILSFLLAYSLFFAVSVREAEIQRSGALSVSSDSIPITSQN